MNCLRKVLLLAVFCGVAASPARSEETSTPTAVTTAHGFALHGDLQYGPDFENYDYVNPDAPKGGKVRLLGFGTFDSFNVYAVRGTPLGNFISWPMFDYETLMAANVSEPASQYGLIAENLTYPSDHSWVEYKLRPQARWHDGKPITPEDVQFTYETLQHPAVSPTIRRYINPIERSEITGPRTIRFYLQEPHSRRNIFDVGLMPVLAKHYWEDKDISAPMIEPPLQSGPYKYGAYELGRFYTYERVKDHWAANLPVNRGRFNYDELRYSIYRDPTISFEAFKVGDMDIRLESSHKNWAIGYDFPAHKQGRVIKSSYSNNGNVPYQSFQFNQRRELFQDPVFREALQYAFDFKWLQKNIFYGEYIPTRSYFGETDLAHRGLPSDKELALLEPYRDQLPARVFTEEYNPPITDGTQESLRENLRIAAKMLLDAGYEMHDGKLYRPGANKPIEFEVSAVSLQFEPLIMSWAENLRLLGITAKTRIVERTAYARIMETFNFDAVATFFAMGQTPGPEQFTYWGSANADVPGSYNYMGIENPVVDAMIQAMTDAETREDYVAAARAFDRVMCWNFYSSPLYNNGGRSRFAYWDRFGKPDTSSYAAQPYLTNWWIDPDKDSALKSLKVASN